MENRFNSSLSLFHAYSFTRSYLNIGSIIDIINNNGVGVIPTDTSYSFVTKISNREGTERIMELIGAKSLKKPLSLLVKDLSTIR